MSKGQNDGMEKRKPTKLDSNHEGIFDSTLVRGLIVLLCLTLLTLALLSLYGYSHNAAESSDETASTGGNANPRARSSDGPCTFLSIEYDIYTIKCSDIPDDTGEVVASYINENSNNLPADKDYMLHIENCQFTGNTLSTEWLPVLNTQTVIRKLRIKVSAPTTIEENAFNHKNFQTINYLTLEGSIAQLNGKCFGGLTDLETLELWINGSSIGSVAQGILNDVPNLLALQIQSDINDEHLNDFLRNTTLHSLRTLSISNNNLNNLKSDALKGLNNLITIDAQFSHLTSIESTILESSANKIQLVNFAYNELQNLPVDIFNIKPGRSIFNVFLQQNKLETLPEGIFDMAIQSSATVKANLMNNPWRCDCDLAWLRDYIAQKKIVTDDVPECLSPETNQGKLLIHADFSACNTTSPLSTSSTTTPEVTSSSTTETVTIYPTTPSTMDNTNDSPPSTTETTTTDATTSTEETTIESSPSTTETTTINTTTSYTEDTNNTTASSTDDTDNNTTSSTEVTTDSTTSSTEETTTDSAPATTETTTDTATSSTEETATDSSPATTETTTDTNTPSTEETATDSSPATTETTTDTNTPSTEETATDSSPATTETTTDTTTSSTEETATDSSPATTETTTDTNTSSTEETATDSSPATTETTTDATTSSTEETATDSSPATTETTTDAATSSTEETTTDSAPATTETTTDTTTSSTEETATDSSPATTETTTDTNTSSTEETTTDSAPATTETTTDAATSSTEGTTTDSSPATTESATDTATSSTTETATDITTSSPDGGYKNVNCICTECSSKYIRITETSSVAPSPKTVLRNESLKVKEDEETGKITVSIRAESRYLLIWTNSSNGTNTDCNFKHFNAGKYLSEYYTSFETARSTSYFICAASISENAITVSPVNCRSHTTEPSPEDRTLMMQKEKNITLAICCFGLFFIVIVSGATIYYVLRHKPTLLKPNKRVIVVHPYMREVILVRGESSSETVTPRTSKTSTATASTRRTSYLTVTELTTKEMIAWKLKQMFEQLSDCTTESAIVFFLQQEQHSLPSPRISCISDTSSYTAPISESSYASLIEPTTVLLMATGSTTVQLMAHMFNQMCHGQTDNCIPEDPNESYS